MARGGERLERRDEETERMTKTEHTQSSPEVLLKMTLFSLSFSRGFV